MSELLVDELTGDRVILAPARALRPDTFRVEHAPLPAALDDCPFCARNEHETPPEVDRVGGGAPDTPGWRVRVVPNKYPIVDAHEVVVLSPAHDADLGALEDTAAIEAVGMLRDRCAFHLAHGHVHAQAFVNHGRAAGASIEHPHAQIIALDFVPPRAETRLEHFTRGAFEHDQQHPVSDGPLVVWCPPASPTPFFQRAALRGSGARFDEVPDDELKAVALGLRDAVAGLHAALGGVAYNVVFESAPRDAARPFQWWIDIVQRVGMIGGFELGTGLGVNVVPPADAADVLRARPPAAVRIDIGVTIDASPGAVWDTVEPIERHIDWMADAERITFTSEQTRGVGTSFDCLTKVGPVKLVDRMTVTEWEPQRTMGIEHRGLVTGRGRFSLRPAPGDRTRFTWAEELHFPWWMGGPLGGATSAPVLRAVWRRNLRRLKTLVENGPA